MPTAEQIADRTHLRTLLAACTTTCESYNIVCVAMAVCGNESVGVYLGRYVNFEAQYRNILHLSDAVATAFHRKLISKRIAGDLSAFRPCDQDYLLAHILDKCLDDYSAHRLVSNQFATSLWIKPVRSRKHGQPWEKKNLETTLPTLATFTRPDGAPSLESEPVQEAPPAAAEEPEQPPADTGLVRETVPDEERKAERDAEQREIEEGIADRFLNTTEGARQGERLPARLASSLFEAARQHEESATTLPPPPAPKAPKPDKPASNGHTPPAPEKRKFEAPGVSVRTEPTEYYAPAVRVFASDEAKVNVVATLLASISNQVTELKRLSALDLEAVTHDPLDHERLKRLCQSAANDVCHFEELLDVAAKRHDR